MNKKILSPSIIISLTLFFVPQVFCLNNVTKSQKFAHHITEDHTMDNRNLALSSNGAYVITSSCNNFHKNYHDNLIDGDDKTIWEPKSASYPQYIELRWKYPVILNQTVWRYKKRAVVNKVLLKFWNPSVGKWELLKNCTPEEINSGKVKTKTIETERLRICFEKGKGKLKISGLEVKGPLQPVPASISPYWQAYGIWFPEENNLYITKSPRYFRKDFIIDKSDFKSAFFQLKSSGPAKVFLNGHIIFEGNSTGRPLNVAKRLKLGTNVLGLEVQLQRNPVRWGHGAIACQLDIHYKDYSRNLISDNSWKCLSYKQKNWEKIETDNWEKVAELFKVKEGIWGKIPYKVSAPSKELYFISAQVPKKTKAGDALQVALKFEDKDEQVKEKKYMVVFEFGEDAISQAFGNYSLARKAVFAEKYNKNKYLAQATIIIPVFANGRSIPLKAYIYDYKGKRKGVLKNEKNGIIGRITIDGTNKISSSEQSKAKITYSNGQAAFIVNNEINTPFFWRYMWKTSPERFYNLNFTTGIRINHFLIRGGIDVGRAPWAKGFKVINQQIRNLLRICPESYIIVGVDLRPTTRWLRKYPDERLITAFGKRDVVSYASKKYNEDCLFYLDKLMDFLESQPYFGRIIGYHPWTCGMPDSGTGGVAENVWQEDRSKITIGDFNPQAIKRFKNFLKNKYKNVSKLRKAWNNSQVTFENVQPDIKTLTAEAENGKIFRNPQNCGMLLDYAEFLPSLLSGCLRNFAKFFKERTNNRVMVFIHYGYTIAHLGVYNNPGTVLNNNNFDLIDVLEDSNIDGYIGAPSYSYRHIGLPLVTYFPWSTIRLRGRMYLPDEDDRYYTAGFKSYGRNYSLNETRALIKRNMGACITRNFGSWFADMSKGEDRTDVSWTAEPEIANEINNLNELYKKAVKNGYKSSAEIAVVFSTKSLFFNDIYRGSTLYGNLIKWMFYSEFFRLGAPFDVYLTDDLEHPDFPAKQYKLIVMMNTFFVSEKEKESINRLKSDQRTILWFYAPGYINTSSLSVENINKITSFKVEELPGKEVMQAEPCNSSHPIMKNLRKKFFLKARGFSAKRSAELHPVAFGPRFRIIDKNAEILAKFDDGKGALAVKKFKNWKSVYSIVPRMNTDLLRSIAYYAGVHVYTDADLPFDANSHYVVINNGFERKRSVNIHLPEKSCVYDALTGKLIRKNVKFFDITLPQCSTKILNLKKGKAK